MFVSLHDAAGELRGCVGTVVPNAPLVALVGRMAVAAATRDPRFAPLTLEDLPGLRLEISVLGPLRPVAAGDIDPACHGVRIRLGRRSAVLLPQVAARQGWDGPTLLRNLCDKAGLPPDAWRDEHATIDAFTVETVEDAV